jgi:autotransporter-associated beta strand protein
VILGQDDAPDADFAGTLKLKYGSNNTAYPQLVKVGNNAQRISGSANRFDGNTIVRAGSLLAGNDSPATGDEPGPFGKAMVFVGDEETPEGAAPAFLADGAYTVANEIRVPDTSPASAVPVLGGTTNANGAVFSGPISLRRDVAFMAGDGATVTFTSTFTGLQGVSKRGGGRVRIEGNVALGGDFSWSGGTLEIDGSVTVPAGAELTVDESLCTRENRGKVFVLLKATGGIDGRFECPQTLPTNWRILQKAGSIRLSRISGFNISVK